MQESAAEAPFVGVVRKCADLRANMDAEQGSGWLGIVSHMHNQVQVSGLYAALRKCCDIM